MYDVFVANGTVATEEGLREADIAVQGERIAAIAAHGEICPEARKVIDASGMLVLPGGVDPHVHYNLAFGGVVSEGPEHSIAAAFGGNTTVIDFAVHLKQMTAHDAVVEKQADLAGRMALDYGLHVVLSGQPSFEVLDEIGDLVHEGLPTVKTMMTYDSLMMDDGHRFGVMSAVAEAGGLSVVHAEDHEIANWLTRKFVREGKTHGGYISETRGSLVEEAAIRRALLLAERTGSPLYILHMAAGTGVRALAQAREKGLPCYGETLTPYLSFTADVLWEGGRGLLYNNYPTIKTQDDQDLLWEAITDDRLQVVSSDHFLIKAVDRNSKMGTTIENLQCGQAGAELRIPVLYTLGVAAGRLELERFVRLVSTNPARIMGLYPRKGTLAVGSDADIVVFDPQKRWVVGLDALHMDSDYSCWEGWELTGKPITVVLRGTVLIENEKAVGPRNTGRFLPRAVSEEILRTPLSTSLTSRTSTTPIAQAPT